jgi:hypothetical protein
LSTLAFLSGCGCVTEVTVLRVLGGRIGQAGWMDGIRGTAGKPAGKPKLSDIYIFWGGGRVGPVQVLRVLGMAGWRKSQCCSSAGFVYLTV